MSDQEQPRPDEDADEAPVDGEQDEAAGPPPQEHTEPAERITRATPQRKQRAPMIRQPEDLL